MSFAYKLTTTGGYHHADGAYKNILVIDDFESGDLASWDIGYWQTVETEAAYRGDYGLLCPTSGLTNIKSLPGDGLANYPSEGDRFEFYVYYDQMGSAQQTRFGFGKSDYTDSNEYELQLIAGETFRLQRDVSGKTDIAAAYNIVFGVNTWYRVVVHWKHPSKSADFVCELREADTDNLIVEISGDDPGSALTGGGVNVWDNEYSRTFVDEIRIIP